MNLGAWFGGCIGWIVGGPLGALLGAVVGSALGSRKDAGHFIPGNTSGFSVDTEAPQTEESGARADRDNFIFSLLVLTACVIKADGRVMHSEMEYVRRFFRKNFGEQSVTQAEQILYQLFRHPIDLEGCCRQMAEHLNYGQRLQLLDFLVGIARADGRVTDDEVDVLRRINASLGLAADELNSMLSLGGNTLGEAYRVLEVQPTASNDELRRAYKAMVLKNHPDRVASLGDDIRHAAEEKLKQINAAYEAICKARGL